jgi:hypothetical protein
MGWHGYEEEVWRQVAVALRLHVDQSPRDFFARRFDKDPTLMLDVVETLLEIRGWRSDGTALRALLESANSAYTLRDDARALELRVAPGVRELVQQAVDGSRNSAGAHLITAWNAAYGRQADPSKAYGEAIKASEAALAPHVSPQNTRQTLGTMIADLRNAPQKWKFAIDATATSTSGVETVLQMMQLLWTGQRSRHGGAAPTRLETADEARAAVHIAAALVQFGSSGALARV